MNEMQNHKKNYKKTGFLKSIGHGLNKLSIFEWGCSLLLGVCVAFSFGFIYSIYTAKVIETQQKALAGRVLAHSSNVEREVDYIFSLLNSSGFQSCNYATLGKMREALFNSQYIKNIGFYKKGRIQCSASRGYLKEPITLGQKFDYIKPNGTAIWSKVNVKVFDNTFTFTQFKKGKYVIFYDPFKTVEVLPGNFTWQISHNFRNKEFYFSGHEKPIFNEPVNDWWSMIKSFIPTYKFCNPRNFQCVQLKIKRWRSFVNQNIDFGLLKLAMLLLGLGVSFISLRYFVWRKSCTTKVLRALKKEAFYCNYQPIVDLQTNKIIGVEVLARLNYKGEEISPEKFIPIITENQMTWQFTRQILNKAFVDLQRLAVPADNFRVAFNIFSSDVENGEVQEFCKIAKASNFLGKLVIEITESEYLEGYEAQKYLKKLHNNGIGIAIDDFGTGYSNMQQLEKMNCDILKIDRSFVTKITGGTAHSPMIEHMVNIARSNNMKVVAEGVENKKQLNELKMMGIEYAQGFIFSKPASMAVLNMLLLSPSGVIANDDIKPNIITVTPKLLDENVA